MPYRYTLKAQRRYEQSLIPLLHNLISLNQLREPLNVRTMTPRLRAHFLSNSSRKTTRPLVPRPSTSHRLDRFFVDEVRVKSRIIYASSQSSILTFNKTEEPNFSK